MSVCSAGSGGSTLPPNGRDSRQSPRSKLTPGGAGLSRNDSRGSEGGQISTPSQGSGTRGQLPLFPEDSPAHLTVRPGSDSARMILVTSGRRWRELYESSTPLGLLLRTLLELWPWYSMMRLLIWRKRVTPCGRLYFRLSPSVRGMSDRGSLSWPTLTAQDGHPRGTGGNRSASPGARLRPSLYALARSGLLPTLTKSMKTPADMEQARYSGTDPRRPTYQEAKLMPTLLKRDHRGLSSAIPKPRHGGGPNLVMVGGGKLSADWCEWYMGFPVGWTDIDGDEFLPSATPVRQRKSTRSSRR